MTLKLCGFSVSNYYNKLKIQLLEKGVAFEEDLVWVNPVDAATLLRSPMGKVPFLETPEGCITESAVCAEYIEQAYPQHPLLPADPMAAAKVRELITYLELHIELVARELYPQAFFGGKVSEGTQERVRKQLAKGVEGFTKLAKFSPFVAGDTFTLADCSAIVHLPLASMASKLVLGEDLLAGLPVKEYGKQMAERASVQKVNADRKEGSALMAARYAKLSSGG
ncbi:glutathione S-transferase [Limnohabitans sp. TS-CS-82]|jgi:glutathione S-transferase|uniref:glutathione S-transferase n=1 Tax=Limnohabitans sp. TS-CS-82 TaxID=2094193 RepID=UPI000CF237D8|nr:glutathione S-transferase [Limnohabitans sp. TS-CS-82]PQA81468.1 glutathione S-transferase [Limnohabitans sp. TS-CS-82]